ncbi:hypothetical protein KB559_23535 [Paenibacillus sp. Marseille-P2973]|nr:hypothetical protein [Paenibacillus sp. Marseille-P2973]MBQ4901800.1 hypothetical protein [Paenibacillus sp. Marseille-P2973]
MIRHFFSWESRNLLVAPWKFQLTLLVGALLGSVITWIRWKKKSKKRN